MADLRENVIEFYAGDERATVTFSQGRYITRIKKLAKEYPDQCQITAENKDSTIVAHIPVKWLKIYPGGHGREWTEEEKEEQRKKMAELRADGKLNRNG